ncbi:TolC family protein [Sphingobacterium sp. SGL-16]|uniref:TolC family protein n=1 Tax=Sphingobacterium sp. SGL-16 TaxID=2710883 RepID=UPI0013ED42E0|nr:TolC family protein [Sphingobacterium sp. SGL-16]NGM71855.1 TolC family protein [Sphingobacterium sp. SGL-16]
MKKNTLLVTVGLCLCSTLNDSLFAQEQLNLFSSPVESAIRHNKSIQNANLENKKVALDREDVRGKLLPKVSMNALYGYVNTGLDVDLPTQQLPITGINLFEGTTKGNVSSQVFATGVTATQVIFSGLQITNGQKALEQKQKALSLMTEAGYDQLAQDVITSFDQLMLLKEVDVLINDSEKRLNKEHLKVVKAIENGVAIPYDRDKIKLAMLELESKRAEIQSNRELLYYKLEELTGLPMEELQAVSYPLQEILLAEDATAMNRKEIETLETSQKAYEFALKKEKGAQLPMLFAFGNISYLNAFDSKLTIKDVPQLGDLKLQSNHFQMAPTFAVGVGMKWNIFEGKSHKAAVEKAKLDLEINNNKLEDTKEKLSLLQRKTKSDYELAMKKISVNQQQMTIAKNNMYLASRQFEEGLQDVTERLEAENEYYKQSLNYYNQILSQRTAATEVLKSNGNLYQTISR